jgi:hypothetical protein
VPRVTTYCAPCITELALVREAVTAVSGTASCMAHAILLSHPTDDPGRRRQRLGQLRDLAAVKAETASPAEQVQLELLVHEYGLASAMDMGPSRRGPQDGPRRGPDGRPRDGRPGEPRHGEARHGEEGERRPGKSRRGRPRPGDRPDGERGPRPEGRPGDAAQESGGGDAPTAAPTAASNGDDQAPVMPGEGSGERAGLPPAPAELSTAPSEPSAGAPAPAADPSSGSSSEGSLQNASHSSSSGASPESPSSGSSEAETLPPPAPPVAPASPETAAASPAPADT